MYQTNIIITTTTTNHNNNKLIIIIIIIIIITIISGEGTREAEQGVTGGEEAGDRDPAGALHT